MCCLKYENEVYQECKGGCQEHCPRVKLEITEEDFDISELKEEF